MRYFITTFLVLLVISATMVYRVDPANRHHEQTSKVPRRLEVGEVLLHPHDLKDFVLKASLITEQPSPDTIVLGSSRALLIGESTFANIGSILNLALGGGVIADEVAIWQKLRDTGRLPRLAIIVDDPWYFEMHRDTSRWIESCGPLRRFLAIGRESLANRSSAYCRCEIGNGLGEVTSLFRWELVRPAFLSQIAELRGKADPSAERTLQIAPLSGAPAGRFGLRWDGARLWPDSSEPAKVESAAIEWASEQCHRSWETSSFQQNLFGELLRDFKNHGIEVWVISTPLHPAAYRVFSKSTPKDTLTKHRAALYEVSAGIGGVRLCDAFDPARVGCNGNEFMDGYHAREPCLSKTIEACMLLELSIEKYLEIPKSQ